MKRALLMVMFVLSLFIMCGGCEEEWGHDRGEYRHSVQWESDGDRDRDRDGNRYEEQHEEHHGEVRW